MNSAAKQSVVSFVALLGLGLLSAQLPGVAYARDGGVSTSPALETSTSSDAVATVSPKAVSEAVSVPQPASSEPVTDKIEPIPDPAKPPQQDDAETMDDYVGQGGGSEDPAEVLKLLQEGNSGKPLTIGELARINDAMKRMEYAVDLQRKMNEVGQDAGGQGGNRDRGAATPDTGAPPVSLPTFPQNGGNTANITDMRVLRVYGAGGNYTAIVSDGTQQNQLKVGDTVADARVTEISMTGVRVSTPAGYQDIPFAGVQGVGGVSFQRR